jgi:hypothetical protein
MSKCINTTLSIFIIWITTALNHLVLGYCRTKSHCNTDWSHSPILWIDFKATKTRKLSLKGEIEVRTLKVDKTWNLFVNFAGYLLPTVES